MKVKKHLTNCRVCGNNLFTSPLLFYKNMPGVAQHLPNKKNIKKDFGTDLGIYQCSGCGLVQLNNLPVSYYREVIRAASVSEEMKKFRIKQFKEFLIEANLKNKKLIEIGCGHGEYLEIMQKQEVNSFGLEYSQKAVDFCIKGGLIVSRGYIETENYKIENSPFDGFFILNFLEHLPNINAVLRGIYNNLTDNGTGLVEVPNFDMILEKNLFSEFMNDHLFYFNQDSLKTTLKINGFEVLKSSTVWYGYMISMIVKKVKKLKIDSFNEHQDFIKKEILEYIGKFKGEKIAIWGAGHQAFSIISLVGLADKVSYIVDSAEFKQNKFSPASHLPIFSSDRLVTEPVKAVIVMAASYSDEVTKHLTENFDNGFSISILRDYGLEKIR